MADESQNRGMDRRRFLTVLGVTGGGAAVLSGCSTEKIERLVPYLVQSEDQVPGVPTVYASTCTECPAGCGLHVKTREGRAIKLEGNPDHPVNRGKLCALGQSSLQGLYNPDRLRGPMLRQPGGGFKEISWDEAIARLAAELQKAGSRVAVLSGAGRGTFSDLLAEWTAALGGRLVRYEPFDHEPLRAANRQVFGRDELPVHDFARARYIVSFGADFLEHWLSPMENQRGFAESHGFNGGAMAKHVYFAPRMSLTGMNADEWHPITPGSEAVLALAMANVLLAERAVGGDLGPVRELVARYTPEQAAGETGLSPETIRRIAREFASARPSLAVAGGVGSQHRGAAEVCAAVNILNYVAGNVGETVRFGAGLDMGDGYGAVQQLAQAMDRGEVALLLVHEANPVYTLPKASRFAERMAKVPFKVSTSLYLDETAAACDLLLPDHHPLERWDDRRPRAGVNGLLQPVMQPVFNTRATGDVLLAVSQRLGGPVARFNAPTFEAHLRAAWGRLAQEAGAADAEAFWREALARGGVFRDRPAAPA
ncbi:MAG TPA: molybdopterin-dependent oxidoreductase, partial [Gemmatimonadales bacterium]|nr:molybdopterin-dependent oxidoreductase [Gemmatimonadales bacterium]